MARKAVGPPHRRTAESAEIVFDAVTDEDDALFEVQARFEAAYLDRDGIEGVGQGRTDSGDPAITAYVRNSAAGASLPRSFSGYPVLIEVVGTIDAL